MNANLENRETKDFWYPDVSDLTVTIQTGYKCEEEGAWWFPKLGWTLFEGRQIFTDKKEAAKEILKTCRYHIPRYQKALIKYGRKNNK